MLFLGNAVAQTNQASPSPSALKQLSVEELLNLEVTLASKRPEKLSETASAIQVVTGNDIQRSGALTLPEALRLAPNLQVARNASHGWAISARGFNSTLANKLLVMIDGRTIYTPLYAGVFWDVQNVLLEDIDRIEVVSGPGGSLWGANAVNGIINIRTKSAKDTQGAYVSAAGGSFLQDFGAIRYGGGGSNFFFRVYGQRFDHNNAVFANGLDLTNGWDMTQGGFRTDWLPSDENTLTVQGDVYSGSEEGPLLGTTVDGQNVLARWNRVFSPESDLQAQIYFDRTWRRIPNSISEDLKTYDFDFQHRFPLGSRQSILWGGGYRLMQDEVNNHPTVAFLPPNRNLQLFSGFAQDEITVVPERLKLVLGTKVEHNDFSGFEIQPGIRLAWTPHERHTVWAAVSRAVRSPSRVDADLVAPASPPFIIARGTNFNSEKLLAYEAGYRVQWHKRMSVSLAAYYNFYSDLRTLDQAGPTTSVLANHSKGETWGVEVSANYQATDWWRLRGGYNFLHKRLWLTSPNASPSVREGNDPENQFSLQSIMDLPAGFQFDLTGRYVDTLPSPNVQSYVTFDARLAWRCKNLELAIVGQNLWDPQRAEFGPRSSRQEIPRSIYGKVTWRF